MITISISSYHWTKKRIIAGINILHDARFPLADGDAIRDPTHPFSKALSQTIGKRVSAEALHRAACRKFGTWNRAVKEAKLECPTLLDQHHFWRRTLVIQAITVLRDYGSPVTSPLFYRDKSPRADRILEQVVGRPTTRKALFRAAIHYFGSWDRAVELASLEPDLRWNVPFWTRPVIRRAIRSLHKAGVELNVGNCKISSKRDHLISNVRDHAISWKRDHPISRERDHLITRCS